jgi:DNA-directed RNA polymerase subunit E'
MGKIGITCRQPFVGADDWIAEEIKKAGGASDSGKGKVEVS